MKSVFVENAHREADRHMNSWSKGTLRIAHFLFIVCGLADQQELRYKDFVKGSRLGLSRGKMCIRIATAVPSPDSLIFRGPFCCNFSSGCSKGKRITLTFAKMLQTNKKIITVMGRLRARSQEALESCQFSLLIRQVRAHPTPLWSLVSSRAKTLGPPYKLHRS